MTKPSLVGLSIREAIEVLAAQLSDNADALDLAARHKSNPGSTNGTLAQVSTCIRTIAESLRRGVTLGRDERKEMPANGSLAEVPEVAAQRLREQLCIRITCYLSAIHCHFGPCEPCSCGLNHAVEECRVAQAAGWWHLREGARERAQVIVAGEDAP